MAEYRRTCSTASSQKVRDPVAVPGCASRTRANETWRAPELKLSPGKIWQNRVTAGGPRCTAVLHKRSRPASTSRKRRELSVNPGQAQPTSLQRFTPASPVGKTATHVSASTATKGDAATGHDDDQSMQPSSRETEGANDDENIFATTIVSLAFIQIIPWPIY